MINYIIQVILFQVLFLAVYDLFLSKETFFTKNRWYLLGTAIASFLIPLIKIPTFQKAVPQEYTILLPEIVLSPQKVIEQSSWYENINYVEVLLWLGSTLFLAFFFIKLVKIIRLIFSNEIIKKPSYSLVLLPKQTKAFSFFNYIFLGKDISENQKEKIIQHELVHSTQRHSADLLFFEFLKILMWFNPMIWIYQHRISLVHEYISDAVVTKSTNKENYINNILSDLFQVESISFINQFYKHSLIKKRVIMMTKQKSKQVKQFKYLLLIPVLASMLFYTACSETNDVGLKATKQPQKMYLGKLDNVHTSDKETYLDYFVAMGEKGIGKEISLEQLLPEEREEFLAFEAKILKQRGDEFKKAYTHKFYDLNGRRVIGVHTNKNYSVKAQSEYSDDVPFAVVDQVPTFPGCADGDKNCFTLKMREFVQQNFNVKLADNLGLEPGKQRVFIQFKIDKDGKIVETKARAPHEVLKEEALRITTLLPRMKPGEKDGRRVKVGYTLPITFKIN